MYLVLLASPAQRYLPAFVGQQVMAKLGKFAPCVNFGGIQRLNFYESVIFGATRSTDRIKIYISLKDLSHGGIAIVFPFLKRDFGGSHSKTH